MRIGLDSVSYKAILAIISQGHNTDGWLMAGYVNGPVSAWPAIGFDELTQRGVQVARIDVDGTRWNDAAILDVEKGDVQNPATITSWVRNRGEKYGDPIVYCDQSNLAMAANAAAAAGVRCGIWLAKITGIPPLDAGAVGVHLPTNVYLAAVQFEQEPGGAPYDLSVWFADDWHPELASTSRPAAELVNQAYTLTDPAIAAAIADVSRETPAGPTNSPAVASSAGAESGSNKPAAPQTGSASGDEPGPTADPAGSSPPGSVPSAPGPDPAASGGSTAPAATPQASPAPTAPTPVAAGPGGIAGDIDGLISRAKTGIGDLAGLLHSQSFHAAAGRLESAIGEAIQLASLIGKIPGL
jgi:hypothetical protein